MHCPSCGQSIPDVYAGVRCPSCNAPLSPTSGASAGSGGGGGSPDRPAGTPWENRRELGFFPAIFATLRSALFEPSVFFERMSKRGDYGAPMGYAVLLGWLGVIGGTLWGIALGGLQASALRSLGIEQQPEAISPQTRLLIQVLFAVLAPLFLLLVLFIGSGILHVCLWIVGGAREGFEATFRVYSYALGSTAIFEWVPFCGSFVAFFWSIVIQIIGLSRAHGISGGRAAFAVLLPLAVCCACLAILVSLFFGTIMSQLGKGGAW